MGGRTIKESPGEVEWLQGDQKGYAKPYHAPADGPNAWGQGEVRVAGRPRLGMWAAQ